VDRVADSRKDSLAELTTNLVRRFDVISIEDLGIRSMTRNRKLARSILDVGMHSFKRMLTYKCAWHGRQLKVVDRYFPNSKLCSNCGYLAEELALEVRKWNCPQCGAAHDRDLNAARNILAAGPVAPARGGRVRPKATKAAIGDARRNVNQPALPRSLNHGIQESRPFRVGRRSRCCFQ